jgi:hypothetical protein
VSAAAVFAVGALGAEEFGKGGVVEGLHGGSVSPGPYGVLVVNGEEAIELINQARDLLVRAYGVEGQDFLIEVRRHDSTLVWKGQPPVETKSQFPV